MHVDSPASRLAMMAGTAMVVMLFVGLLGLKSLGDSADQLDKTVARAELILHTVDGVRTAQVHFKVQVQEWRNTLLRGFDDSSFERYRNAFVQRESQVQNGLREAISNMEALGIETSLIETLLSHHISLGVSYREGLAAGLLV